MKNKFLIAIITALVIGGSWSIYNGTHQVSAIESITNRFNKAASSSAVTVATGTSHRIVATSTGRTTLILVNDGAGTVYLALDGDALVATTSLGAATGIRLNAGGGSIIIGAATDIPYGGSITALATGATTSLTVTEY